MRVILAIVLTLVAAFVTHATRALACEGGAEPCCCCCAGPEEDEHFDPEQQIAPICGCTVEPAPEHLPPPLQSAVTSASVRMAPEPVVSVTLAMPPGPDRRRAINACSLPKPPGPARSLLAQKTSLLV